MYTNFRRLNKQVKFDENMFCMQNKISNFIIVKYSDYMYMTLSSSP